jgi:CRP/FNR family cyclic AMP-dependent transcriptional regulator
MTRDIDFTALRKLRTVFGMTYPAGYVIFEQGRPGTDFYVILDGEVEMVVSDGEITTVLAVLHSGDFFGEMAVFRHEPRSATARTRTESSLLFFNASTANELFLASPRFAYGIIRTLCDRIGGLDHEVLTLRRALQDHRQMEESAGLPSIPQHRPATASASEAAAAAGPTQD